MRTLPKVSPSMLDGLLWFYENRNWDHVRIGTTCALLDRKLVEHRQRGESPSLITDDGVAVLLAHGRLVHNVGDTVRSRATGEQGTVSEIHPTYVVTTVGTGGVAAFLPVSQLPAVWTPEPAQDPDTATAEVPQQNTPELNGLEQAHTDGALISLMRHAPLQNTRRRRAELLLQLPTPADRVAATKAAYDASCQVGGPDLVDALAQVVAKHPSWRPVSCGGRYLPCRFEDGTGDWGIFDTQDDEPGGIDWVEIDGGVTRWASFEQAAADAANLSRLADEVLAQKAWEPSVVRPGDRIEGQCVTNNRSVVGAVVTVVGPIKTPDCGGYRYLVQDDAGRRHTVFASRWV